MPSPADERLGEALASLLRHQGWRQADLALRAGVSRRTVGRIVNGRAGALTLDTLRRVFEAADAGFRLTPWWRGAALDRLLDERHAALVERTVRILEAAGWHTLVEVSFSEYGERGSMDVLAGHEATRCVMVVEAKATLGSLEETNRSLDVKTRLAGRVALARFGWAPRSVSRLLVITDGTTARRIVARHEATLRAAYPVRGRAIRRWLRRPDGAVAGLWFLSEGHQRAIESAVPRRETRIGRPRAPTVGDESMRGDRWR